MKKIVLLFVVSLMSCVSAWAQMDEWGTADTPRRLDWWFGTSLGVTHSLAENATSDDFIHNYPGVDMQVGTYLTKDFGLRLSWGLNPQLARPGEAQRLGDPETYDTHYRFQVLTGYLDALVDLTTLFQPRKKYRPTFDVLLYVGGGALESFGFSKKVLEWDYYPVDYFTHVYWAAHAGLMTSYRFAPHWDMTVEGSYNITDSGYDGVPGHVYLSGYVKFHAGVVYHIYDGRSKQVRLSTDDTSGWAPSYTEKDREKVHQEQAKRIAEARKLNEKLRDEKSKEYKQRVKALQKERERAQKELKKKKEKKERAKAEARLYNEP